MKKLFVVLIALCCCFSLIHAQSPVQTESQVVDAEVLNTVLQGINEMLETIETRLSAIEGKLGVETPATKEYGYYGTSFQYLPEDPANPDSDSTSTKFELVNGGSVPVEAGRVRIAWVWLPDGWKSTEGAVEGLPSVDVTKNNNYYCVGSSTEGALQNTYTFNIIKIQ